VKKYSRQQQRVMADWAARCAERVLPFFEKAYPKDDRPRQAIEAARTWVRTGVFKMTEIRYASLSAHAAAREAKAMPAACFAARSAGHAVGTAHVPQHAFGASCYALKALLAAGPSGSKSAQKERKWQAAHLPERLKPEFLKRVVLRKVGGKLQVRVIKDEDF